MLGIHLIAGRGFGDNDRAGQPPVMLIDRTVARSGFLGENPIGKHVCGFGTAPIEVIGVVENIRQLGLEETIPQVFVDLRQFPPVPRLVESSPRLYYAVRTQTVADSAASVRSIVRELDPHATVDNIATMNELVSNSIARSRLYAVLLGMFATAAMLLAAIGIYGVMTYGFTVIRWLGQESATISSPRATERRPFADCRSQGTRPVVQMPSQPHPGNVARQPDHPRR